MSLSHTAYHAFGRSVLFCHAQMARSTNMWYFYEFANTQLEMSGDNKKVATFYLKWVANWRGNCLIYKFGSLCMCQVIFALSISLVQQQSMGLNTITSSTQSNSIFQTWARYQRSGLRFNLWSVRTHESCILQTMQTIVKSRFDLNKDIHLLLVLLLHSNVNDNRKTLTRQDLLQDQWISFEHWLLLGVVRRHLQECRNLKAQIQNCNWNSDIFTEWHWVACQKRRHAENIWKSFTLHPPQISQQSRFMESNLSSRYVAVSKQNFMDCKCKS